MDTFNYKVLLFVTKHKEATLMILNRGSFFFEYLCINMQRKCINIETRGYVMKGYLVLGDGSIYEGTLFGDLKSEGGELVFNTSMTGYQEIITDPSYYGQIVVMTYPLIGNYGVNQCDHQHDQSFVKGFVVRECNEFYSHWKSDRSMNDYLKEHKIIGIKDIDTRALTKKIRDVGTMEAQIIKEASEIDACIASLQTKVTRNHVAAVTTEKAYTVAVDSPKYKVAAFDFGIKKNMLQALKSREIEVKVVPAFSTFEEVMDYAPDGLFLSNGPGNPEDLQGLVKEIKKFFGLLPIFGICLGHQLLAHCYGGETEKLKYGHRGGNHPVKDISKDRVYITAQNHGYVVVEDSLDLERVEVTHYNVNDLSIEGLKHKDLPIMSIQYHPEASPGPVDSDYIFDEFLELMTLADKCS